ncbi:MAG: hypothetical protein ACXADY_11580 [Candidatus Hodarchaeales archaeon]|jgi:Fe-S-cluster containining protein
MILRGFSRLTAYNCAHCHLKCCATEYDLPLLPHESASLYQNYPFTNFFIKSSKKLNWLLRGDSCPFLTSLGRCKLHNTQFKPVSCQIYPLIFWKINSDEILVWINPCRGTGFQWVTDKTHHISEQALNNSFEKVKNCFSWYWGEQIDKDNPFERISQERIREEINFFKQNDQFNLIPELVELNYSANFSNLLNYLTSIKPVQKDLKDIINAAIHWLCWSPIGLQLTFLNSKLIFLTAAKWININSDSIFTNDQNPIERKRLLQQVGSFLATAILPSFWKQVENETQMVILRKFAIQARKILSGTIPQQLI